MVFHKYKAVKTEAYGQSFPSKMEGAVYCILLWRQKAGEIAAIERQQAIVLTPSISWKVDFKCTRPDESKFVVEAKGYEDRDYSLKRRLWKDFGKFDLEVWKGDYRKPFLHEIIKPGKYYWKEIVF